MRRFITFEGGDGAGKTTLINKVSEDLRNRGLAVCQTRAPGATPLGQSIRELLLHKQELYIHARAELFLFLADRSQHVEEVILPALEEGKIVLCDRFNDSTLAYQSGARGLSEESVSALCQVASNHLQPDLTVYLDIDPEVALKRVLATKDRMERETIDFHRTIRRAFQAIGQKHPNRFRTIDASRSPGEVFDQAMELINVLL